MTDEELIEEIIRGLKWLHARSYLREEDIDRALHTALSLGGRAMLEKLQSRIEQEGLTRNIRDHEQ